LTAVLRERVSAVQLAGMIKSKISTAGVEIVVREDHAYGLQPNVVAAPCDLIGFQRRAEKIANRLRFQFDLCH
jgi:hypothetical protein